MAKNLSRKVGARILASHLPKSIQDYYARRRELIIDVAARMINDDETYYVEIDTGEVDEWHYVNLQGWQRSDS